MTDEHKGIVDTAKKVLKTESDSISALTDRIGPAFVDTVILLDECRGKVILTGIGKSGLIGMKRCPC